MPRLNIWARLAVCGARCGGHHTIRTARFSQKSDIPRTDG